MQILSRRRFIASAGAAASLAALPTNADPLGIPIGLQLYTVQDRIQADFDGTLRAVASIGYRAVETGLNLGGRTALQLRDYFQSLGLIWKSAHINAGELQDGLAKTIEQAHQAELAYLVCAFPIIRHPERFAPASKDIGAFAAGVAHGLELDDWKFNADLFNKVGEAAKKAGLQFAYHNHNLEFRSLGGTTGYDTLLARTDPGLVKLELDCGWMVSAGKDPVEYLAKYPGRYAMLHVKDLKAAPPNTELKMQGADLGTGIIDWPRLFNAAKQSGIAGYFVEQEPPYPVSSLDSIKADFAYLKRLDVG